MFFGYIKELLEFFVFSLSFKDFVTKTSSEIGKCIKDSWYWSCLGLVKQLHQSIHDTNTHIARACVVLKYGAEKGTHQNPTTVRAYIASILIDNLYDSGYYRWLLLPISN